MLLRGQAVTNAFLMRSAETYLFVDCYTIEALSTIKLANYQIIKLNYGTSCSI